MSQKVVMFETSSLIDIAKGVLRNTSKTRELLEALKKSVRSGRIKVVYTHIQVDEISEDEAETRVIQELFNELEAELLPTGIGVWGISRWNMCRWGGELEHHLFDKLRTPQSREKWLKDLIQALTTIELDIVVTNDRGVHHAIREIRKEVGDEMKCEAYNLESFQKWLQRTLFDSS